MKRELIKQKKLSFILSILFELDAFTHFLKKGLDNHITQIDVVLLRGVRAPKKVAFSNPFHYEN